MNKYKKDKTDKDFLTFTPDVHLEKITYTKYKEFWTIRRFGIRGILIPNRVMRKRIKRIRVN